MNIIYTCPKCGADLQQQITNSDGQPIDFGFGMMFRYVCPECGWYEFPPHNDERVIRIPYGGNSFTNDHIPDSCKNCPNHPSNGGSGICHCILGLPPLEG